MVVPSEGRAVLTIEIASRDEDVVAYVAMCMSQHLRKQRDCAAAMQMAARYCENHPDAAEALCTAFKETLAYQEPSTQNMGHCATALARALEASSGSFGAAFKAKVAPKVRKLAIAQA